VLSIRHQSELRKYIVEKEQESARVRRVYERIVEADKVHTASASRERSSIDFVKEALDRIVPTEGPHAPTFPERLLLRELELMPPALGAEFGQGDNRGTFFFDAESQFWITHRNHRASRWSIHPTPSEIEAFPWPRDAFWGFPHRGEFVWFIRRGDSGSLVARDGRTLTAEVPLPPAHEPHEIILPNHEFVVAIRFGRRISVHSFESGLTIASTELPGASIDRVQFVDHDQELFFLVGESVYSWQWQDEISPRPIATIAEAVSWTASPSGKHLVAQAGRDLVHVDVESGEQTLLAPDATCSAFCFSPDERLVAVGQSPRWLRVYDLSTSCEVFRSLAGDAPINHLAFHESSELIAGGSDLGTVRLWEIGAGCIVASAPGHSAAVRFAQVSDDGTRFLTGADDFVLRGWRVEDDKLGIKVHPAGSVSVADPIHRCGTVSADLETYAMGRDDGFVEVGEILWKGDDLRIAPMDFVRADTARLLAVRFSPSGHLLATGSAVSKILTLWNVRREPGRMKLERRFSVKLRIGAQRVDFSPDGRLLLVSIAHNPTSVIVDCETDSVVAELSSASRVHAAAFSPDSRNLLAGGQTGTFSVFRVESTPAASIHVETLSLRITGDTDLNHGTKAITFIPGTHMFFTGGSGGALEVWELVVHGDNRSIVQFAILKEHQLPITA
ncbi:MAG TPA: WD40 repeat domain-containing protein, partial [Planctomycetota bacterium]|nr:WD40 repeat domain-containing protein [Planctomycetota bacterium]